MTPTHYKVALICVTAIAIFLFLLYTQITEENLKLKRELLETSRAYANSLNESAEYNRKVVDKLKEVCDSQQQVSPVEMMTDDYVQDLVAAFHASQYRN